MMKPIVSLFVICVCFCLVPCQAQLNDPAKKTAVEIEGGGSASTPGQFFYYNIAGIGYYRTNPTASSFPAYPTPISLGGAYLQLSEISGRTGHWRAASGYYYPWCPPVFSVGGTHRPGAAIYTMVKGIATAAQPSVATVLSDMREFIEDAWVRKQIDKNNYENLSRRLNELAERTSALSGKNDGSLTETDDKAVRHRLDLLGEDLTRAASL